VTANCVVFELELPQEYALWRDATSAVLSAFSGGLTERTDGNPWVSSNYPGYKDRFVNAYPGCKLGLAAYRAKYDTEYRPPLIQQDVIKPHSMSKYRVINDGAWVFNPFSLYTETSLKHLHDRLTMEIDTNGPYGYLRPAVSTTNYTSNDVITSQAACPESITLHEHEAFGHIRAGHRLQWRNMLRELRRGILNTSHEDVHLLFLQAMWQAGPKSMGNRWRREAHADGAEADFGIEAIREMGTVLNGIEDNWTLAYACATLAAMAARILSLTDEPHVQDAAVEFLKRTREVARRWLKDITGLKSQTVEVNTGESTTAESTTDSSSSTSDAKTEGRTIEKAKHALLVAALCCSTFDVDEEHISHVFQSPGDTALFIECRHIICMNKPPVLDSLPYALHILFRRDELLALRLLPRVTARVSSLHSGIDNAIKSVWRGYLPTGIWSQYGHYNRWYTTRTAEGPNSRSIDVHFNLLGMHKHLGNNYN
jgi:hypothetical protein